MLGAGRFEESADLLAEVYRLEPVLLWSLRHRAYSLERSGLDAVPNDCSLRGAIHWAHLAKVGVEIELPAGTFELATNGASEDLNVTGDLDIRRNLTIRGQGPDRRSSAAATWRSSTTG